MFCKHCGNMAPEGAKFCDSCGAPMERQPEPRNASVVPQSTYPQPYEQVQEYAQPREPKPSIGFVDAIVLYFKGYADFSGRSRRSEYWYAALFTGILSAVVTGILPDVAWILSLALIVPNLAVCVRRLHDIGKSGWSYLFSLIPLVGGILLLIWMCRDSEGDNEWGESPKY